jgi:D-alanyl-D-alanine carboxypeptidase
MIVLPYTIIYFNNYNNMKHLFILLALALLLVQCRKRGTIIPSPPPPVQSDCVPVQQLSDAIVPAAQLTTILENYVAKGFPGISFIARKGDLYWEQQRGMADKEKNKSLKACMVWPGFNITKMYTATVILKLKEEGKINLDRSIAAYLPAAIVAKVPRSDKITVRMLLNHSSGIENFWDNSAYVSGYLANPTRSYIVDDYLNAAQKRLFEPGTDAAYSNTNFLILSLIIDQVTGKPHRQAYEKYITKPLGFSGTYYKQLPASQVLNAPELYADMEGEGKLTVYTDNSFIQFKNEYGSNGILATPKNYVDFLHVLTHAGLLHHTTLNEMKTWFTGTTYGEVYGLGLEKYLIRGKELYGHSGSSFGGRTMLLYFPEKDLTFFIGVNAGAESGGPVMIHYAHFIAEITTLLIK